VASARIALALTALALLGAGPAAAANFSTITNFSIASGGPPAQTQTGRLHPGGPASSCVSPKTAPAVDDPGTSFNISALGEKSSINEPTCVTVTYSTANASCQANGLFSAAYVDDFDRAQVAAHYLGDVGSAPTNATPATYSVVLPGGKDLTVNWNMSAAGTGCAAFDIALSADRPWAFAPPPIKGHPFVGETLTSIETQWSGAPTLTRQWRRCAADGSACVDIPGATATTYTPAPEDVGHTLRTHVTATEGLVSSTADSDPVQIGIQFDAADGGSLSVSDPTQHGHLNRGLGASACGSKRPTPGLVDTTVTRFYDSFRHTNASESPICTLVSLDQMGACSTSDRTFSAAYLPAFDPATSVQKNYLADGGESGRAGALTHRYGFDVPAGADYDVVVTTIDPNATCPGYDLRFGTASPYPTGVPAVDGTAQAGQALTAGDGSWTGTPASFAYQWQRCFGDGSGCGDIPGANAKTLALTGRNVGDSFRVRVTATEGLGSASKTSAPSAAVAEAPPAPPPPEPPAPPAWTGIALKPVTKTVGGKGLVTLSLACPADAVIGCVGTDLVRLGKATLTSKPFAMAPGKTAKVGFTLSKAVRKRLAKRKQLTGTQVVSSFDSRGAPVRKSAKLTLKAKKKRR
jgi:hypothetical protein